LSSFFLPGSMGSPVVFLTKPRHRFKPPSIPIRFPPC